jgi:Fe2+ transport system protein FeoA
MKSLINMNFTLLQAAKGKKLKVLKIEGDSVICDRLFEIGFSVDEEIEIQQQLLWNGPMIVAVRGTQVALRESEAQCITIQPQL